MDVPLSVILHTFKNFKLLLLTVQMDGQTVQYAPFDLEEVAPSRGDHVGLAHRRPRRHRRSILLVPGRYQRRPTGVAA